MKNLNNMKNDNKPVPKNSLICGKNVYFSRDCHATWNNNNVLVVGTSGCGKTRCVVEPALLQADSSYVVSDPKGMLHKQYAPFLESLGYRVVKMDFIHPEKSAHYNPIQYCKTSQDILKLAYCLTYSLDKGSNTYDPFWDETASILFSAVIGYLVENEHIPDEEKNIESIIRTITMMHREPGKNGFGYTEFAKKMDIHNQWMKMKYGKESWAYRRYHELETAPDKTYGTILLTALAKLAFFDTEEINEMLRCNDINFETIGIEKTAIFVEVSDSERSMDALVNLFYSQMINRLCTFADDECKHNRLPVPVQFILDDFATNTHIDNFDKIISNIRSRNISAMVMVQSEEQLEQGYGEYGGRTIANNCSTYIYLGGTHPVLAAQVGPRMNQELYTVLTMPTNMCYIFRRGKEPFYCEHFDLEWYKKQVGFEEGKPSVKTSKTERKKKADSNDNTKNKKEEPMMKGVELIK